MIDNNKLRRLFDFMVKNFDGWPLDFNQFKQKMSNRDDIERFFSKYSIYDLGEFTAYDFDEFYQSLLSDSNEPSNIDRNNFPLKEGSRGPEVAQLQKFLNNKIVNNPLTIDGVFGPKTKEKLIQFQKQEGYVQ
jgi:hypothetical protein